MTLLTQLKSDLKQAMISNDDKKKKILRVVIGEVQRRLGAESDDDVHKAIRKIIEGNIESLKYGDNPALTEENNILNEYLPKMLTKEEIETFLLNYEDCLEKMIDAKNEGQATGIAMKALKANGSSVDGKDVKEVVQKMRTVGYYPPKFFI